MRRLLCKKLFWALLLLFSSLSLSCSTLANSNDISILGITDLSKEQQSTFKLWTKESRLAVENKFGPLPNRHLAIELNTKLFTREPVPWGEVRRDNYWHQREQIDGIYLIANRHAKAQQLLNDWTLYHEISHLYLPYLDYASFWLSEGFATYAQNLVMLKSQTYSRQRFIEELRQGFQRGKLNWRQTPGSLAQVTENMREQGAFKRVYWTGTAYFLEADEKLQQVNLSLPQVIKKYVKCCIEKTSTGLNLAKALDHAAGKSIFVPLYLKYKNRDDFPQIPLEKLYQLAYFYQPNVELFTP